MSKKLWTKIMETKTIEIEIPEGKKAEWVNGVLTLVDESQTNNRPVTERIKTFEDARRELGSEHPLVEEYDTITCRCGGLTPDILAYMKLRIICTALNEGWKPKFTKDEWRYFPWFGLYTQEDIEDMDENENSRMLHRSHYYASANGEVAFTVTNSDASNADADVGTRLVFRSRELAIYAGKQFIELYADLNF